MRLFMDSARRLHEASALESLLAAYAKKPPGARYRKATWLLSDYEAEVWTIESDITLEVDWRVTMYNGKLLTTQPALWEALRSWLIVSTHVDFTGREIYAPAVERNRLQYVIHCIDYLLLNAEGLELLKHGLEGVSANDLKCMIGTIASNRSVRVSIYEWPKRLAMFLRTKITQLPDNAVEQALDLHPDLLAGLPDRYDCLTNLNADEIVLARTWIALSNRYYVSESRLGYRLIPRASLFIADIYPQTLGARSISWTVPIELCLGPEHRFQTEYPRASVYSSHDERMDSKTLNKYVESITALAVLRADGINAPRFTINELTRFAKTLSTKKNGRFRTLPSAVAFGSLRRAIEYALAYGDGLVDSYLALAEAAYRANLSVAQFTHERDIQPYLTDDIRNLGVCRWSIEPFNAGANGGPAPLSKQEWFKALRANQGFYEALRVLYGAIQIVVGLLMARRSGELNDLVAGRCLDNSSTRLVFKNRKSGIGGMRQTVARPIPPVGSSLIKLLDRLQSGLIEIGALKEKTNLFAYPSAAGTSVLSGGRTSYMACLDLFCDWEETPLDAEGKRYYLRQHQLRRFFAMLFFWGGGFGGMDALRWFLAHTDVKHLWHYITESTPGVTIRSVAAEWGVYQVKNATGEGEILADELADHFGTRDFSVLEEQALVLHLEDLIEEGRLTIEPQFLDSGKQYRIAVLLRPKKSS